MARKNVPIRINSHYLPERGELLAAAYGVWLRAMHARAPRSEDDMRSLLTLHAASFRALLRDDIVIYSADMALDMASAILSAIDAHSAPARYVAAGNVRSSLADARRDAGTFWGSTPVYVLQAERVLRVAIDVLADSVLHDGMPLDAALELTDRDRYYVRTTQEAAA